MARKPRDYKAEYQRRIRNAEAKGYSRSQARGHARTYEIPISINKTIPFMFDEEYFRTAHTKHRIYDFTYKNHEPGLYHTVRYRRDDATRAFVVIQFVHKDGTPAEAQTHAVSIRGGAGLSDLYHEVQKLLSKYDIQKLPKEVRDRIPMQLHLVTPVEPE